MKIYFNRQYTNNNFYILQQCDKNFNRHRYLGMGKIKRK